MPRGTGLFVGWARAAARPGMVLMDMPMPEVVGLAAMRLSRAAGPGARGGMPPSSQHARP